MSNPPHPLRRYLGIIVILLLLLAGIGGGAFWYLRWGQWYETTENAYLTGNLVVVSAQVAGTAISIGADESDQVRAGQEILRLGDGDTQQVLRLRREALALAVQEVAALRADLARARAELALREVTWHTARDEYERRQRLSARRMVSDEERDAARTRADEAAGELATARQAVAAAAIRAGNGGIAEHPAVLEAAARLRTAWRAVRKAGVVAPVNGQVARRRVQAGQFVEPGMPLFTIAQREGAWVEANFKENQLRHIRPGQPVTLTTDLYGDEVEFHGRVESIGAGTGAVFSLLPPQNATGNWIKIVQRVPVRIHLDKAFDPSLPLPFGASLHARVDTHDRSGPRLKVHTRSEPLAEARVYAYQNEGVEEVIAEIIRAQGAATPAP